MNTNVILTPPKGFGLPVKKTPRFTVSTTNPASGRGQVRVSTQVYPIWDIEWTFNYLLGSEQFSGSGYQLIVSLFGAMRGPMSSFLLFDPYDNSVTKTGMAGSTAGYLGVGDGVSNSFQLVRQIGILTDIVQNPNPPTVKLFLNGLQVTAWVMDNVGVITFATPPPVGAVVQWEGNFYYRAHFVSDSLTDMEMNIPILNGMPVWSCKSIKFESIIL